MPLQIYVSRDSGGQPWPPDHEHEARATLDIVRSLHRAFDRQQVCYAVLSNLHQPSADLLVVSERGLGVIELKHYYGKIWQKGHEWYAGPKRIASGSKKQGYRNPHEQVQAYATKVRTMLVYPSSRHKSWLPDGVIDRREIRLSTAVCFTHPDVEVEHIKHIVRERRHLDVRPWEHFEILVPNEVPDWAASLRFEVTAGPERQFQPRSAGQPA